MNQQPTLINLFRGFYQLRISSDLSCQSIALFHSILYRSNELGFPDKLKITNSELCESAGICKNTLMKCRKTLIDYFYDGQWLIKYQEGTTHQCGFYSINYDLLTIDFRYEPIVNQMATNSQPKENRKSTNGATLVDNLNQNQAHSNTRSDQKEEIRKDSLSPTSLSSSIPDDLSEGSESEIYDNFKKGKRIIENQYPTFFVNNGSKGLSKDQRDMITLLGANENAEGIFKIKAQKAQNPLNAIIWTAEELQVNKKQKQKEDEHIDINAIWDDQDAMFNLITYKKIAYRDDFLLTASRLTELYQKSPEDAYGGLREFFLDITINEFVKFHNERMAKQ